MKFNWGTKIGLAYTLFVFFILGMVYLSFGEKFELVTEDYYAEEIAYQDKIDSKARLNNLDEKLLIDMEDEVIAIRFPHKKNAKISGKVICFRPSDESKDFELELHTKAAKQHIPLERFIKGKYLIKVDWSVEGEKYYAERTIIIP